MNKNETILECTNRRDRANAVRHAEEAVWVAETALVDTVLIAAPWAFSAEREAVAQARGRLAAARAKEEGKEGET